MSRPTNSPPPDHAPPLETLGPLDVHVWLADPDAISDPRLLAGFQRLLNAEEQARLRRFRLAKLRHDFLIARAFVRTTLSRYLAVAPAAWEFTANEYGRPEILAPALMPRLRFNLSHTRGLAACAVTWDRDVGVDVEAIDRKNAGGQIARRFFSPSEVQELESFPADEQATRFFDYWTLKESYIKARGMGLALPLDQFSFSIARAPQITIAFTPPLEDDPQMWQFWQTSPSSRHRLALALREPKTTGEVTFRDWSPGL